VTEKLHALRDVLVDAEVFNDGDWVETKDQDPDGDVRLIQLADVGDGFYVDKSNRFMTTAKAKVLGCTFLEPGDLLVARMPDPLGRCCMFPGDQKPCVTVVDVCVIRPCQKKVFPRWLMHCINSPFTRHKISGYITGTTRQRISRGNLASVTIPLPPLSEQKRIAEILDRAEALRAKRRAALALLDELTQSIFLDMFGADNAFPSERLDSVCELITDGTHYTPTYAESGVIFLSSRNVTSGYITWDDVKFIPESLHYELHRRVAPRMNDVLLAKNGTTGIAAMVDRDSVFDIYVSLALLRPSERVVPIYLQQAVNSPACTKQFNGSLKGIGVPNLHLKDIRKTTIPVPPIQLQHEFARRMKELESMKTIHRESLETLDQLFASLQHRAFRGEL
jgi:type I restriction enzyme, S subunit